MFGMFHKGNVALLVFCKDDKWIKNECDKLRVENDEE